MMPAPMTLTPVQSWTAMLMIFAIVGGVVWLVREASGRAISEGYDAASIDAALHQSEQEAPSVMTPLTHEQDHDLTTELTLLGIPAGLTLGERGGRAPMTQVRTLSMTGTNAVPSALPMRKPIPRLRLVPAASSTQRPVLRVVPEPSLQDAVPSAQPQPLPRREPRLYDWSSQGL